MFFLGTVGPTSCLFGDILNLLPDQVLKKVHEPVYFSQEITKGDIQKALGVQTLDFLFTKDGHSRSRMGDVPRDSQLVCHDNLLLKESPLAMDNAKAALQAPMFDIDSFASEESSKFQVDSRTLFAGCFRRQEGVSSYLVLKKDRPNKL